MADHPSANALSTGAILSTYQRTRVESVALRLGLTPLSYLWKYPILPPGIQTSLLEDMVGVGLDGRIVKVASGGLDESFLWQNVASEPVTRRIERSMKRFGTDGDGAVLGEGGEFETLVIDGPASLFKGRIEIQEKDRRVVREGGGSAWLKIREATVVMKSPDGLAKKECRIPDMLEPSFRNAYNALNNNIQVVNFAEKKSHSFTPAQHSKLVLLELKPSSPNTEQCHTIHWEFAAQGMTSPLSITDETRKLIDSIRQRLDQYSLKPTDIISSIIILRSMQDFASVNKVQPLSPYPTRLILTPHQVYSTLFTHPNPPSRVTISCGDALPIGININIYLKLHNPPKSFRPRKALHVQSRSYWAPANIGPYSQAISIPLSLETQFRTVNIAGQIPLIPHTMALPAPTPSPLSDFNFQAVLALQHLWRIGLEMDVSWWTSAVAYLHSGSPEPISKKAALAGKAWEIMHPQDEDEDTKDEDSEARDLWEEKHYAGMEIRGGNSVQKKLPNWEIVSGERYIPPFWAVEVEELPRGSAIEWHAHLGVVAGPVKVFLNYLWFGG
jgi:diphthine-ammonia ligase